MPLDHRYPMIIAEIGSVHDGSFGNACALIRAVAETGADAVKFQTHVAEAESLADAPTPPYFSSEDRIEYFKRTAFSGDQWCDLVAAAHEQGLLIGSSPFAVEAVEILENAQVDFYKVASGEVTNHPLLERLAGCGKPVMLSSGMSSWEELDAAVDVLRNTPLTVMQCTSAYPCPPEQVGLNVIGEMIDRYSAVIGYSDHSEGAGAALAAAALGARIIEKHVTFSRRMYGSDAKNAMELNDFTDLVRELRRVWSIVASPVDKSDLEPYLEMKRVFEKSIVTSRRLAAGTVLEPSHLAFKKPGDGLRADRCKDVLGKRLKRDLPMDHQLKEEDLQ